MLWLALWRVEATDLFEPFVEALYLFIMLVWTQGPEEICLSLEHQNPSKTSEKMGYFDRVTVSLHIL